MIITEDASAKNKTLPFAKVYVIQMTIVKDMLITVIKTARLQQRRQIVMIGVVDHTMTVIKMR